jgi:lysophospholipase L1-like esterase
MGNPLYSYNEQVVSQIAGIDPSILYGAVAPITRATNLTAVLGDSRVAQIFSSQTITAGCQVPTNFSGYNHFSWGNARAGQRLKVVYAGGLSGDRSDQMLARLNAACSPTLRAGHLYIQIGVNDISQSAAGYTTVNTIGPNQNTVVSASNVALVCFQNIQYAVQTFLAHGGQVVTICLEPGGEGFSTTQIGNTIDLNQYLREYAEQTQNILLFDTWSAMHDPALSSTSTIRFKANYAQESSGSGVHQGNLGGYAVGALFANFLTANFPSVPYLPTDVNELPTISVRNQLANPMFVTTSGGTASTGVSGTVPGNWTVDRSGGSGTQTAVVSSGTPADGSPGKECIIACTFGAAGDLIRLRQDVVSNANWSVGDIVEGVAQCVIDAGGALAGIWMDMQQNDGTTTFDSRDLIPFNNSPIGTDGCTVWLRTPPFYINGKSGSPFLTMRLYAQGSAASTATVRWRSVQIRKRFAL